jgi:hypothetical protein
MRFKRTAWQPTVLHVRLKSFARALKTNGRQRARRINYIFSLARQLKFHATAGGLASSIHVYSPTSVLKILVTDVAAAWVLLCIARRRAAIKNTTPRAHSLCAGEKNTREHVLQRSKQAPVAMRP